MGILQRLFRSPRTAHRAPAATRGGVSRAAAPLDVVLYGGGHDLEVVGESYYQDALWGLAGGRSTERVRVETQAVLIAEMDNAYDENAVSVWIGGMKVGHLSRDDAKAYRPGLLTLQSREGRPIALRAVIVGGGIRQDGPGYLGVWMSHDPADFGVTAFDPPPAAVLRGSIRTGLTEALLSDEQDDSYDLSWLERLPSDPVSAIAELRRLLQHDPDPIDRHFMFCELEEKLYRARDAFSSALSDYDEACIRHDAEMEGIRDALLAKFGKVPLLDTYRQMAIRQQKAKEWGNAIWWAERGLSLYGDNAARPEAVDDLAKRLNAYRAKLAPRVAVTPNTNRAPSAAVVPSTLETLVCAGCGSSFERPIARGRKPRNCLSCR